MDLVLLLLLLGAIMGLLVSYDLALSTPLFYSFLMSLVLYSVLARLSIPAARSVAWAMLGLWAVIAWYFISQYTYLDYPGKIGFIHKLGKLSGNLAPNWALLRFGRNMWATLLEGGLPFALVLGISSKGRRQRIAAAVALASLGYAVLLTASRGAWVALACAGWLAVLCWLQRRLAWRTWLVLVIGLGVFTLAGVSTVLFIGPEHVPGIRGALGSAASRIVLYGNTLHLLLDFPLTGIGFGDTFALIYSRAILLIQVPFLTYAHDFLLSVWLNHGFLGLLGYGLLLVGLVRLARRGLRQGASALFWGAMLAVLVSLLHGIADATQYDGRGWPMLAFYIQLGLLAANAPQRPIARECSQGRRWCTRLACIFGLLALALIWPVWWGIYQVNRGAILQSRADLAPRLSGSERAGLRTQAASCYRQALDFWPAQIMAQRRLGLLALDEGNYEEALTHLQYAWKADPTHPANSSGLGYAYLWNGQLDAAEALLVSRPGICQELGAWARWRGQRGERALAEYAAGLAGQLCPR